ncbi:MAG: hypothetical protein M3Z17_07920 [Gemmatimonadota bacterium]|nr:hypothetical protein [Gemmatimonadota bacterium]
MSEARRLSASGRPLLLVAGRSDQFITPKVRDAQVATLKGLGISAELQEFDGGHEIDRATIDEIARTLAIGRE